MNTCRPCSRILICAAAHGPEARERNRDGTIHISQPPGEANALGRVRFNFPNKFLVYQHDTPDKHLFAKEERAFSHGCMRVQNPDQYASTLLNIVMPNERYTPEKIRSMYGRSEIDLKFPTPIPVNITYQTAFVDDAGKLQIRKDIYGRDAAMIDLLKNSRNKDLETMVAHAQPSYARPTGQPAGRRQLRQRQHLFLRTLVLRAPVRRPVDRDAAGPGRPPPSSSGSPGNPGSYYCLWSEISKQNQQSRPLRRDRLR